MNVIRASKDVNETGPNAYSWEKKAKTFFCNSILHFTIKFFPVCNIHATFFLMVNSYNFLMYYCATDFGFTN